MPNGGPLGFGLEPLAPRSIPTIKRPPPRTFTDEVLRNVLQAEMIQRARAMEPPARIDPQRHAELMPYFGKGLRPRYHPQFGRNIGEPPHIQPKKKSARVSRIAKALATLRDAALAEGAQEGP